MRQERYIRGLHTVAVIEAAKGIVALLAGLWLFSLLHHDLRGVAERVVEQFHLNPTGYYPRIFIAAVGQVTNHRLLLACGAMVYSAVRLAEAYGLWHNRRWAEWFAVVTGAIYVPFEIYELAQGFTWMRQVVLLVNLFIVAYMIYALWQCRRVPST